MSKIGRLRDALMELWAEHKAAGMLPTSARFLFYELETRGVVSKVQTGKRRPDQDVIDALTDLREAGRIPWDDIIDETRTVEDYSGAGDVRQWVLSVLERARIDPWAGVPRKGKMYVGASPHVPLVITESRSLAGALRNVVSEFSARIASTNGQASGFLRTRVADKLSFGQLILYFGDLDFSGGHIEANTRRVLERNFCKPDALRWERLALTEAQARQYKLTPIRKFDKRDGKHHDAIETEALSQSVIVETLRTRLTGLLPEPLARVRAREEHQRRRLRRLLAT
jgi:hypothetical protein